MVGMRQDAGSSTTLTSAISTDVECCALVTCRERIQLWDAHISPLAGLRPTQWVGGRQGVNETGLKWGT